MVQGVGAQVTEKKMFVKLPSHSVACFHIPAMFSLDNGPCFSGPRNMDPFFGVCEGAGFGSSA